MNSSNSCTILTGKKRRRSSFPAGFGRFHRCSESGRDGRPFYDRAGGRVNTSFPFSAPIRFIALTYPPRIHFELPEPLKAISAVSEGFLLCLEFPGACHGSARRHLRHAYFLRFHSTQSQTFTWLMAVHPLSWLVAAAGILLLTITASSTWPDHVLARPSGSTRTVSVPFDFAFLDFHVKFVCFGETATVAADVCTRPCVSVAGTRCTRCTPDSYLRVPHLFSPLTVKMI